MKIVQVLPTIERGDAVGNECLIIDSLLKNNGYDSMIYATNIGNKIDSSLVKSRRNFPSLNADDIIIYHLSTGDDDIDQIIHSSAHKIFRYHNITPPEFFKEYDQQSAMLCESGLNMVRKIKNVPDLCLAVSDFNASCLKEMGYKCPIITVPILIPFEDYDKKPNVNVINKFKDDENFKILFTGRVVPNKKIENLITAFYYYHKHFHRKSQLFLVGRSDCVDLYSKKIKKYIEQLNLTDSVIMTGRVPFDEILAYYKIADLFLCLSEHEGFCVPLVEAMKFKTPILALDKCAVGSTLNEGGILVEKYDPLLIASIINEIQGDEKIQQKMIDDGQKRLKDFSYDKVEKLFLSALRDFTAKNQGDKND